MANLLARRVMAKMSGGKGKRNMESPGLKAEDEVKRGNLTPEEQTLLSKVIEKKEKPSMKEPGKPLKDKKIPFSEIGKKGLKANE